MCGDRLGVFEEIILPNICMDEARALNTKSRKMTNVIKIITRVRIVIHDPLQRHKSAKESLYSYYC